LKIFLDEMKNHVQDLLQVRLLIRSLLESPKLGPQVLGQLLTTYGRLQTIKMIFEEEYNLHQELLGNAHMVLQRNVNGKRVVARPIVDLCIVRKEVEPRRSKRIKHKSSQL